MKRECWRTPWAPSGANSRLPPTASQGPAYLVKGLLVGGVEGLLHDGGRNDLVDVLNGLADALAVVGVAAVAHLQRLVDARGRARRHRSAEGACCGWGLGEGGRRWVRASESERELRVREMEAFACIFLFSPLSLLSLSLCFSLSFTAFS